MTDTIDDEIIEVHRRTTSSSTPRRPLFIETEVRTDTISKRRAGSTTSGRSVYDILQNTKSPTDGLPPTTYTYAHSVSYMPVTQNGTCDVPVMARRDLHGSYRSSSTSRITTAARSVFYSPAQFLTYIKTQIVNGYSTIRDRFTHQSSQQESPGLINSSITGTRHSRSSSQSSTNGQAGNYNLRRRGAPVHSTPRDNVSESKLTSKQRKDRQSQDGSDVEDEKYQKQETDEDQKDSIIVRIFKKFLYTPIQLLSFIVRKFFGLPWWLLIPLLLFLGLYAFPNYACKPFEHYPESKIYQNCRNLQQYANNVTNNSIVYLQDKTFNRGGNLVKRFYHYVVHLKDSVFNFFDDIYASVKKSFRRKVKDSKETVNEAVDSAKQNAKEYCEAGLKKVNGLIEDLKREKAKYFGAGHALKPDQEVELDALIRHLLDEYAADETGQADYALEANGGKVVDTRCTEYTDEPRQNVVKFLGIPIVHMSKQPNIMIKAGRMPGQCFPFKGDQGSVVIKLAVPVRPTEFAIEHLSKSISIVGHINSAPNNFTVYALKDKNDKEGTVLGRYFYDAENGPSLQRFVPQLKNVPVVEYIEVRVTSNWGNPNYTCLYRFRVHGDLQSIKPSAPPAA